MSQVAGLLMACQRQQICVSVAYRCFSPSLPPFLSLKKKINEILKNLQRFQAHSSMTHRPYSALCSPSQVKCLSSMYFSLSTLLCLTPTPSLWGPPLRCLCPSVQTIPGICPFNQLVKQICCLTQRHAQSVFTSWLQPEPFSRCLEPEAAAPRGPPGPIRPRPYP